MINGATVGVHDHKTHIPKFGVSSSVLNLALFGVLWVALGYVLWS
jgi:hypothetical protein